MSSSTTENLLQAWEAAKATPFQPLVAKDSQFFISFALLLAGKLLLSISVSTANSDHLAVILTGTFALSPSPTFSKITPWLTIA